MMLHVPGVFTGMNRHDVAHAPVVHQCMMLHVPGVFTGMMLHTPRWCTGMMLHARGVAQASEKQAITYHSNLEVPQPSRSPSYQTAISSL